MAGTVIYDFFRLSGRDTNVRSLMYKKPLLMC